MLQINRYAKLVGLLGLLLGLAACQAGSDSESAGQVDVLASGQVDPGPTPTLIPASTLPDLGPAPDIANETWLNTDQPLSLESLRGKVVLVEFWTFG